MTFAYTSTKLARWCHKLTSDYPNLKLRFISTSKNVSDFLTRSFDVHKKDLTRLPIKCFSTHDLDKHIDHEKTFTLSEWKIFVQNNENLIKIIDPPTRVSTVLSLSKTAHNLSKLIDPVKTLTNRLQHENIAIQQKKEFTEIINKCIADPKLQYIQDQTEYTLKNGLLYMQDNGIQKILMPPSLEGILIAYHHLTFNHCGLQGMLSGLYPYTFPQKTAKIQSLITRCYPCVMQNSGTRKHMHGSYPIAEYQFATCFADIAESLPVSQGYQHLLIFCCSLSQMIRAYPLKLKTASSIAHWILFDLFQYFKIRYLVTDNAACFNDKGFLSLLHSLNITKIQIGSLHPRANGIAESRVKILKTILRKSLSVFPTYDWVSILPLLVKQYNLTINNQTGFPPLTFLHGPNNPNAESDLSVHPDKIYPLMQNHKIDILTKCEQKSKIIEFVKNQLMEHKIDQQFKSNKNKILTKFLPGDIVFVEDKKITQGVSPALRTHYSPDAYVVLQDKFTTSLVQRLVDGFQTIYSKDMLKKYNPMDAQFSNLPPEVHNILKYNFNDLDQFQFNILRKHSNFDLPSGPPLTDDLQDEIKDIESNTFLNDEFFPDSTDTHDPLSVTNEVLIVDPAPPPPPTQLLPMNNLIKPSINPLKTKITSKQIPIRKKYNTRNTKTNSNDDQNSPQESSDSEDDSKKVNFSQ